MKKQYIADVYKSDNRTGFASRIWLGTISYNNDDELDSELKDIMSHYYNDCHTEYTVKPRIK